MSILAHPTLPVRHPSWCDPRLCLTTEENDGTFLVTHATLTLDDTVSIEVMQADEVTIDGSIVSSDPAIVHVTGMSGRELAPAHALEVAAAVVAAATLAAGARAVGAA